MLTRKYLPYFAFSICTLLAISGAFAQSTPGQGTPAPTATSPSVAPEKASVPALTIDQIVEKNTAARGGLAAWRAVQTIFEQGKMDAGGRPNVQLPFTLMLKRPRKTRLELTINHLTAVQTYDGQDGWTYRPYLGRTAPEPYTEAELAKAAEQQDLDGPLVDYAAKGTKVDLVGVESVEGHDAYKLKLTLKNNQSRMLWIDAQSFLELEIEDTPRFMDRKLRQVFTYYRDYRAVDGLMIPFVLETAVQGEAPNHKTILEKVVLNAPVNDVMFAKPVVPNSNPASMGRAMGAAPLAVVPPVKR